MVIEPLFEEGFSESSYGFRPGRSQKQAVAQACKIIESGKTWTVDIDLENFFDEINQDKLINLISQKVSDKRVLRLIGMILRSGVKVEEQVVPTLKGASQGSPLSPLLSNIMLNELDKELERRNLSFCRYADDCNIFVRSERAAKRVLESITRFIETRLKLRVNLGRVIKLNFGSNTRLLVYF